MKEKKKEKVNSKKTKGNEKGKLKTEEKLKKEKGG